MLKTIDVYSLFSFKIEVTRGKVDFRYERTLFAGTTSAASLAALSPGSSARAVPLETPFFTPINGTPYKMNEVMDMMTKNQINEREQLEILTIEQLVPQDHLVRKLDAARLFGFSCGLAS